MYFMSGFCNIENGYNKLSNAVCQSEYLGCQSCHDYLLGRWPIYLDDYLNRIQNNDDRELLSFALTAANTH